MSGRGRSSVGEAELAGGATPLTEAADCVVPAMVLAVAVSLAWPLLLVRRDGARQRAPALLPIATKNTLTPDTGLPY